MAVEKMNFSLHADRGHYQTDEHSIRLNRFYLSKTTDEKYIASPLIIGEETIRYQHIVSNSLRDIEECIIAYAIENGIEPYPKVGNDMFRNFIDDPKKRTWISVHDVFECDAKNVLSIKVRYRDSNTFSNMIIELPIRLGKNPESSAHIISERFFSAILNEQEKSESSDIGSIIEKSQLYEVSDLAISKVKEYKNMALKANAMKINELLGDDEVVQSAADIINQHDNGQIEKMIAYRVASQIIVAMARMGEAGSSLIPSNEDEKLRSEKIHKSLTERGIPVFSNAYLIPAENIKKIMTAGGGLIPKIIDSNTHMGMLIDMFKEQGVEAKEVIGNIRLGIRKYLALLIPKQIETLSRTDEEFKNAIKDSPTIEGITNIVTDSEISKSIKNRESEVDLAFSIIIEGFEILARKAYYTNTHSVYPYHVSSILKIIDSFAQDPVFDKKMNDLFRDADPNVYDTLIKKNADAEEIKKELNRASINSTIINAFALLPERHRGQYKKNKKPIEKATNSLWEGIYKYAEGTKTGKKIEEHISSISPENKKYIELFNANDREAIIESRGAILVESGFEGISHKKKDGMNDRGGTYHRINTPAAQKNARESYYTTMSNRGRR